MNENYEDNSNRTSGGFQSAARKAFKRFSRVGNNTESYESRAHADAPETRAARTTGSPKPQATSQASETPAPKDAPKDDQKVAKTKPTATPQTEPTINKSVQKDSSQAETTVVKAAPKAPEVQPKAREVKQPAAKAEPKGAKDAPKAEDKPAPKGEKVAPQPQPEAAAKKVESKEAPKPSTLSSTQKASQGQTPRKPAASLSGHYAQVDDLDDLDSIPDAPTTAFAANSQSKRDASSSVDHSQETKTGDHRRDIYAVAGRAAPQRIAPQAPGFAEENTSPDADPAFTDEPTSNLEFDRMDEEEGSDSLDERDTIIADRSRAKDSRSTKNSSRGSVPSNAHSAAVGVAGGAATVAGLSHGSDEDSETQFLDTSHAETKRYKRTDDDFDSTVDDADYGFDSETDDFDDEYDRHEAEEVANDPRRGTTDFGLFLFRIALGAFLLFHGVRTIFDLGSGNGVNGLKESLGFMKFADLMAWAIPGVEIAAGALLILGIIAPVATILAVAVTSFMAVFSIDVQDGAFSLTNIDSTVQFWLLMSGVSVALCFSGPGRIGIDFARGWARRPLSSGWISVILGLAAAGAAWYFLAGTNPFN